MKTFKFKNLGLDRLIGDNEKFGWHFQGHNNELFITYTCLNSWHKGLFFIKVFQICIYIYISKYIFVYIYIYIYIYKDIYIERYTAKPFQSLCVRLKCKTKKKFFSKISYISLS